MSLWLSFWRIIWRARFFAEHPSAILHLTFSVFFSLLQVLDWISHRRFFEVWCYGSHGSKGLYVQYCFKIIAVFKMLWSLFLFRFSEVLIKFLFKMDSTRRKRLVCFRHVFIHDEWLQLETVVVHSREFLFCCGEHVFWSIIYESNQASTVIGRFHFGQCILKRKCRRSIPGYLHLKWWDYQVLLVSCAGSLTWLTMLLYRLLLMARPISGLDVFVPLFRYCFDPHFGLLSQFLGCRSLSSLWL